MKKHILIGPLILFLAWWYLTNLNLISPLFLSKPDETLSKSLQFFVTGEILPDIWATFYRTMISFFITTALGVPIGLILGSFKKIYASCEFVVDFFRSLPATALFPLFILVFGIGDIAEISAGVFVSLWIVIINSAYGVLHTSKTRIKLAQVYKATRFQIFKDITFFEALPHLFSGLRISLLVILIVIVMAEMLIGTKFGLGQRIFDAYLTYKTPDLYAIIMFTGLLGYFLNKIFFLVEKKVLHWPGK